MKIAVIISRFPVVSETFILNQITGMIERGHQVSLFSRFHPTDPVVHPDIEKFNLLKKTCYFPHVPRRKWPCRIKAACLIVLSFFRSPIKTIQTVHYVLSALEEFSYPVLFMSLTVFRKRFDVVHCHYGNNGNMLLHVKRINPKLVFITMFHGHDIRLGLEGGKDYYRDLFATADLILANSDHTRKKLLEQGVEPGKTRVHHVGIELEKFPACRNRSIDSGRPIRILTVSRLHPDKGVDVSIRAVRRLIDEHPFVSIEYIIAGDGALKDEMEDLVRQLKLETIVTFLGALDQKQVIEQLQKSDLFLLTSHHEGLGMVLLEAQAVGLPVVATQVDGIPEAVNSGESALLAARGDIEAIADQLYRCIQDPEKRKRMGQAGRKHVEENFDIQKLNDRLENLYSELRKCTALPKMTNNKNRMSIWMK